MIANEENYYCLAEAVHAFLIINEDKELLAASYWNANKQLKDWTPKKALNNVLVKDLFDQLNKNNVKSTLISLNKFLDTCV